MARQRNKENEGLPKRWRFTRNAYYYQVPPGKEHLWDGKQTFRLGSKLNEAYNVWAERLRAHDTMKVRTLNELFDRYALEVIPTKAAASQTANRIQLAKLREVFGAMPLLPFPPRLVYEYVDRRSAKRINPETGRLVGGKVAALREAELLSHCYTKAVEWGYIDEHPFKGEVRLTGAAPQRPRYVEDWEVIEALKLKPRRKFGSVLAVQAYLRMKLLTGMSQGDLLRLQPDLHFTDEGIDITRHKTQNSSGKQTVYLWEPDLVDAVATAFAVRPNSSSKFLFCNRKGEGYIDEATGRPAGWKSMWQRFMVRVLKETKVKRPFTEHDLRGKVATDQGDMERARALLSHADMRTTAKWYVHKERVAPAVLGRELREFMEKRR